MPLIVGDSIMERAKLCFFSIELQHFRCSNCIASPQHCTGSRVNALSDGVQVKPCIYRRSVLIIMIKAFTDDCEASALLGLPGSVPTSYWKREI